MNETNHVVHGENPIHSTPRSTPSDTFTSPTRHAYAYKGIHVVSPSATEDDETTVLETPESELLQRSPASHQDHQGLTPTIPGASSLYSTGIVDCSKDLPVPESLYGARPNYTGLSYTGIPHFITDHSVISKLISCYFKNVSRWCELTDSLQTFTAVHGRLLVQSSWFGPAALALSAKFLENTEYFHGSTTSSSRLYEHARSLLQETSGPQADPISNSASFRLTAVVLSLYCAMAFQAEDTRTQLRSYINALQLHTWEDPLALTSIACFWAMARLGS